MKAAAHASRAGPSIRAIASRRRLLAVVGAAAVVLLAIPVTASSAQFVWNLSPSAPGGLYRIERDNWTVGDRVAVLPPKDLAQAVRLARAGIDQHDLPGVVPQHVGLPLHRGLAQPGRGQHDHLP